MAGLLKREAAPHYRGKLRWAILCPDDQRRGRDAVFPEAGGPRYAGRIAGGFSPAIIDGSRQFTLYLMTLASEPSMGRLLLSVILAVTLFNCCSAAFLTNFDDLPLTTPETRYAPGSSFTSAGIKFTVVPYPYNVPVSVTNRNYAKGGGNEIGMGGGVGVSLSLPPMASQVAFKFAQVNWNGLTINGQSTSGSVTIKHINGILLGGVSVAVVSSPSLNYGSVTLTGPIETLTIGGIELWIDDLSITAPITTPSIADFTGDAKVDGADFLRWQRHFGVSNATHDKGDADGDKDVDRSDLVAWRYHFGGSAAPAVALAQSVPEPSTAMLGAIAIAALRMSALLRPARRQRVWGNQGAELPPISPAPAPRAFSLALFASLAVSFSDIAVRGVAKNSC